MTPDPRRARSDLLPSLGIVLGGILWGLFWLPVRALQEAGLEAGWSGVVTFASVSIALLPLACWRWRAFRTGGWDLLATGLLTGAGFALYAASILLTEVVRTLLLFYMSPIWATILGLVFLGERLTLNRGLSLVLGIAGLLVILGLGSQFPWPRNLGDWLALASGFCWAYGSLRIYRVGMATVFEQTYAFGAGAFFISLLVVLLPLDAVGTAPGAAELAAGWPWLLAVAVFLVPANFLTIWPASVLSPGRVGILLMGEIVVGVASAAALTDEPFGLREGLGTVLIIGAGLIEVWRPQRHRRTA